VDFTLRDESDHPNDAENWVGKKTLKMRENVLNFAPSLGGKV